MNQSKQMSGESTQAPIGGTSRSLMRASVIGHLVLVMGIWGVLIAGSGGGLDFTDESFALMSYRHPEDVTATFSMFHVVLSPIYHMGGESLPFVRIFGMIVLLGVTGLSALLTVKVLSNHALFRPRLAQNTWHRVDQINLVLLAMGGAGLFYADWRLTPTYDWMTLLGLLLFWAGLLLWLDVERASRSMLGAGLIGFTGAFIFWGKATSAAVLPLFMLIALRLNREKYRALLAPSTLIGGLIGFALGMSLPFLLGESPSGIVEKFQLGTPYQQRLKPGQYSNLLYFFGFEFLKVLAVLYALGLSLLLSLPFWGGFLLLALSVNRLIKRSLRSAQAQHLFVEGVLVIGWIVVTVRLVVMIQWVSVLSLALLVIATLYLLIEEILSWPRDGSSRRVKSFAHVKKLWRWIIPLLGLFVVYSLGAATSYLIHGGRAGHLVLMAAFIPLIYYATDSSRLLRTVITVTLLAVTLVLVVDRSSEAFRQAASVWEMDYRVTIPGRSQTLYVSDETAAYIEGLQSIAYSNGFKAGMPLIDMTGNTPGAAYVLNARVYVFPWALGGYENANEASEFLFSLWEPNLLQQAWILTGDTQSYLSVDVLTAVGLRFPEDYEKVGEVPIGYIEGVQALWRPRLNP